MDYYKRHLSYKLENLKSGDHTLYERAPDSKYVSFQLMSLGSKKCHQTVIVGMDDSTRIEECTDESSNTVTLYSHTCRLMHCSQKSVGLFDRLLSRDGAIIERIIFRKEAEFDDDFLLVGMMSIFYFYEGRSFVLPLSWCRAAEQDFEPIRS